MAINPKTGMEDPNYSPTGVSMSTSNTDIRGQVDTSLPSNAQSLGGVRGNLDIMNEYRRDLGVGAPLTTTSSPVSSADQSKAGISNTSGMLSNLQEVQPTVQPTVQPIKITAPEEKSMVKTEIAPPTPPTTTTKTQEVPPPISEEQKYVEGKKNLDVIFQANNLNDEEKKYFTDNFFKDSASIDKFMKMTPEERTKYFQDIRDAQRLTRDANLAAEQRKSAYDSTVRIKEAEFATQKAKMQDNIAADAQNMAMVSGGAGRLQSRQLQQNITNQLNLNQQVYSTLLTTQDAYMDALKNEFEYANRSASNQYNDAMASIKKDLQEKIASLQATGLMNTKNGLLQAQSFIDQATSNGFNAMKQYSYNLQVANERTKLISDQLKESNQYDEALTQQKNDGTMYNKSGQAMLDAQGNSMKYDVSKGKIVGSPQEINGKMYVTMQSPKGDITMEEIKGQPVQPTMNPEQVQNIADGLANGTLDASVLKMLPSSIQQQVLSYFQPGAVKGNMDIQVIGQNVTTDEFGNVRTTNVYGVVDRNTGKVTPMEQFTSGVPTSTAPTTTPSNVKVVGKNDLSSLYKPGMGPAFANNNPGNIKDVGFGGTAGGVGGFTKFNTVEEGIYALGEKIKYNQANGVNGVNNGSAYNGNMSLYEYFAKYAPAADNNNPKAYAETVAMFAGVPPTTAIKDVSVTDMMIPIIKHENGAMYRELVKRGIITQDGQVDIQVQDVAPTTPTTTPTTQTTREIKPTDQAILQNYYESLSSDDPKKRIAAKAALDKAGLTENDVNVFKESPWQFATPEQKKGAKEIVDDIDRLLKHKGFGGAVGSALDITSPSSFQKLTPWTGEGVSGSDVKNFNQLLKGLIGKLKLENMGKIKGVLSDSDMKMLGEASSGGLSSEMGEEQFIETANKIKKTFEQIAGGSSGSLGTQSAQGIFLQNPLTSTGVGSTAPTPRTIQSQGITLKIN